MAMTRDDNPLKFGLGSDNPSNKSKEELQDKENYQEEYGSDISKYNFGGTPATNANNGINPKRYDEEFGNDALKFGLGSNNPSNKKRDPLDARRNYDQEFGSEFTRNHDIKSNNETTKRQFQENLQQNYNVELSEDLLVNNDKNK